MKATSTTVATLSPEQAALLRLAGTRAQLSRACGHASSISEHSPGSSPSTALPLARLASQGVIGLLAERWRHSPWRLSLQLADQTADTVLRPLAQRHPVGLVLAAGAAGGLVTLIRPWRWLPATSLLALGPLAGRAIARAVLQGEDGQRQVADPTSDARAP